MIVRRQYLGCLNDCSWADGFAGALDKAQKEIKEQIQKGNLLRVSLYYHENMCFLYSEAINWEVPPGEYLSALAPYMELWPEVERKTAWVSMSPVYYHSTEEHLELQDQRRTGKKPIGRIAYLHPDKVSSYVYWHKALVEEGLFKGDRYQFISIHETILFSYFEEPKELVNVRNLEEESIIMEQWKQQDPGSHFDKEKANGDHFLIIKMLFSIGMEDL